MPEFKQNYFQKRTKPRGPRSNYKITSQEVQVITTDGQNLGILNLNEAVAKAKEAGLDLKVENIHINDIYNVDTVFALSTAKHGIFVSQIDDQTYTEDPLLEIIRQSFTDFIEKERQLNK